VPEQIWILLLFLLVVLFNLITGFLNRRRERDATDEEKKGPQVAPPSRRAPPRVVATPPRIDVSPPPAPAVHPKPRRTTLRRGDLRRAIVLMTLLGPPRAFDDEVHDVKR
jgi:hypothetical protein